MRNTKFSRRFSIGHWDFFSAGDEHGFSHFFENASPRFKEEIDDIYFGRVFHYSHNGQNHRYGEVMGREANNEQVSRLIKIQERYGVAASLTLNQSDPPPEILGTKAIREAFLAFVRTFYDAGIRRCTLSNVHLMASGILQETFPEMQWKNTVNHLVRSAQEVVDYAALGYHTILVDRSLNRNTDELVRIKKVAERLGVKISLLVTESCMPACPFKLEHDLYQAEFQNGRAPITNKAMTENYWSAFGDLSCNRWRKCPPLSTREQNPVEKMPRIGTGIVAATKETLDLYLDNTDIFKFSGRMTRVKSKVDVENDRFVWRSTLQDEKFTEKKGTQAQVYECFADIYEDDAAPFHLWVPDACSPDGLFRKSPENLRWLDYEAQRQQTVWAGKKGRALDITLRTCQNQCYDCHACERGFGYKDFDTLLSIKQPDGWIKQVDTLQGSHSS
ncbi:MAG: hypothetical protein RIR18_606 [Pseudomonadota bacterium]